MRILAFLAILLVALAPAVLAIDANDSTTTTEPDAIKEHKSRADVRANMRDRHNAMKDKHRNLKATRARLIDTRADMRQKFADRREKAKMLRTELSECRGKDTEECQDKRNDAKMHAKDTMLAAADRVLDFLHNALDRVTNSDIKDKDTVTSRIKNQIEDVEQVKASIEALGEDSTRAEYKRAAAELRRTLKGAKNVLKHGVANLVHKRMGNLLQHAEALEDRLEHAVDKLEAKGADVSNIDLSAFEAALDSAREHYGNAEKLFSDARSAEDEKKADLVKQAHEQLREAHNDIKTAHQELKTIVRAIKATTGGGDALSDADDAEESDETESEDSEEESDDEESEDSEDESEDETNSTATA